MGTVFLRGDSWVGEYKDRGKIKRKTYGKKGVITKTMAREMLKKTEQKVKLGQYDMLDAEIPTLNEFSGEYLKHARDVVKKRSWKRDELCLRHLKDCLGDRKLSEITPKDIDEYKAIRLNEVSPATVNRELEVLRHLFNLAERWKRFFGKNPVAQAKLLPLNNQKERILKSEEEQRLLASSSNSLKAILTCALNTGMRKGEIISLKWSNVDLESKLITLEATNTKSNKTRRIPINSVLRKLLLELKLKSGGSKYVFLSSEGTPYFRQDSLNRAYEGACKRANIQGLRFHDLRHTSATRMVESGANIVAVSRILGHADLKTTMRYSHPENSLVEAMESLTKINFSDSLTDKFTDKGESGN